MNRRRWQLSASLATLAGMITGFHQTALAGPPLMCRPFDIGQAQSLPWSSDGWNLSGKENYDINRLVDDTMALLTPSTPVLVRMETLRRATLYAQKDPLVSKALLFKLRTRALSAEAAGRPEALAWFDLGYLVESYKQANWDYKKLPSGGWQKVIKPNAATNFDGYTWVKKAIGLRGGDPEMEFAAALITLDGSSADHHEHLQKALTGARTDSLLARNLAGHFSSEEDRSIKAVLKARN